MVKRQAVAKMGAIAKKSATQKAVMRTQIRTFCVAAEGDISEIILLYILEVIYCANLKFYG